MTDTKTDTQPDEEEKEYPQPPPGIRVLKNGAGYDMEKKRIADAPGTYKEAPYNITKDNASDMAKRRHAKARQAIRDAIVEQAQARGLNVLSPPEAIGHAAAALFSDVLDGKGTLRDRNRVTWDVAKYSNIIEIKDGKPQQQTNIQINVTEDTIRSILGDTGGSIIDV